LRALEELRHQLVEVLYKDKIQTAYVKDIKGKRLHLLFSTGKEELISHSLLLGVSPEKIKGDNLVYLQGLLREKNELREALKDKFDLVELWEVVVDELEEAMPFELVELYLGRRPEADEVAAFLRKVWEDRVYFAIIAEDKLKVRSREEVAGLLQRRERELARLSLLSEGEQFLKALLQGKKGALPPEREDFWIEGLKEYVLNEEGGERAKILKELLPKHHLSEPVKVVELLIREGKVQEDWFFELKKLRYPREFSERESLEAEKILKAPFPSSQRKDLTEIFAFTIDAEDTEDFDDALSFLEGEDTFILYVHIADVSSWVSPFSALWEGALERASTLYLPEGILPMFPFPLSHGKFSLKKGESRLSLSFKFEITREGEVRGYEILPTLITVSQRWTYDEVDEALLKGEDFWVKLYNLLRQQKEKRLRAGALAVILPEIQVRVHPDGEISVKRIEMTRARDLVAEAMILANAYAARFLIEREIPALFRSQKEPFQVIEERETSLFHQILQLKFMAKSELSTEPDYHSGLGLASYTTVTSPIRRALDLLMQHQLRAYLLKETLLSREDLFKLLPSLQNNLQRAQFLQSRRKKYFLLKYLRRYKMEEEMSGLVLEVQARKARIYLPEYNLTGEALGVKEGLKPGLEVTVKPEKIDPLQERLRLKII